MASKRNKFPDDEGGGDAWLATYGDMITLLMCFFVIFFSVSDVNVALFEDMKNGFKSDVTNTETETPIGMLASRLDSIYDNPEDDDPDVEVQLMRRGINITLGSNDLFGSGSATLSRKGRSIVEEITATLTDIVGAYNLTMDVEVQINETQKVFVERIEVEGNSTTLDEVIRLQFDFVEGDPFNRRKVLEAVDKIRGLGFFKNVEIIKHLAINFFEF